jgi:hypothetical protein
MGTFFSNTNGPICMLLLLGCPITQYAQSVVYKKFLDPYTINVSGRSSMLNNQLIDWSLGESPMVHTFNKYAIYLLSTGFLQSVYDPLLLYKSLDSFDIQIKIGPNPFNNLVHIQCRQDGITISSIQLINFRGDVIYHLPGFYAGMNFYQEIPIQKLSNPICYLYLHYTIANKIERTKIIKLIQN